jgi:ribosomal peptide maturation radical SAM protein 1
MLYRSIADAFAYNDFLFSQPLEGGAISPEQVKVLEGMFARIVSDDVAQVKSALPGEDAVSASLRLRDEVMPSYLRRCMSLISEYSCTMVGFTCMYDQTFASLALAKMLKEKHPHKMIVMGGYALQDPVGKQIMESFDFIDAVCIGEAEDVIVPLARASVDRDRLGEIPGVIYRNQNGSIHSRAPSGRQPDLEQVPCPDYDDWFVDLGGLTDDMRCEVASSMLPLESSRGCWWGETSHCIFCGIDELSMRFRSKSASKVRSDLSTLLTSYHCNRVRFSDYILPRGFFKTLLPTLASEGGPFELHWEVKSNLSKSDIALMHDAGIRTVQPGIESFSSPVLKQMAKGVTGLRNILTLKLLTQHGISIIYNILYGFPHDAESDYVSMIQMLPRLYHLPPPEKCMPVATVRYSPLHLQPSRFGFTGPLMPMSRYDILLSRRTRKTLRFDISNYCYYFERPYEVSSSLQTLFDVLRYQVSHWQALWEIGKPRLSYRINDQNVIFTDSRLADPAKTMKFGASHAVVYSALAANICSASRLPSQLSGELTPEAVANALSDFEREHLVYTEGDSIIGLALPSLAETSGSEYRNPALAG